jgi:hypothetical protein
MALSTDRGCNVSVATLDEGEKWTKLFNETFANQKR